MICSFGQSRGQKRSKTAHIASLLVGWIWLHQYKLCAHELLIVMSSRLSVVMMFTGKEFMIRHSLQQGQLTRQEL